MNFFSHLIFELLLNFKTKQVKDESSRGGLWGKSTTMFKHSCHFLLLVNQIPQEACICMVP